MNINQLKINLRMLESNLANNTVQEVLKAEKFALDELKESIGKYLEKIEQIKDEDLLKTLEAKVNNLISYSNERSFRGYSHQFINAANFLILNVPKEAVRKENNIADVIEISEEEFSKRYDKLIDLLKFENEECNLILETPSEKKPLKIYKNDKSSIIVKKVSDRSYSATKNKLIKRVYQKEGDLTNVYDTVIIEKLLDNSIFDFFINESLPKDLIEAMKNKLSNNENELLKVKSELEKIQKDNQELEKKKEQFDEIFLKSIKVDERYENTIQAAEKKAELGASVSYWNEKKNKHKKQFWIFIGIAIFAIVALITVLFFVVQNHTNHTNQSNKTEITTKNDKKIEFEKTTIKKQKESKKQQQNNTKVEAKKEQKEPFDYTTLAWYALMLFASSSAFWIIRITVKIALSNLHLSEDAYERVVMIQTYLSFVQEGQLQDEKDKQLVLSPLFRPSNIGIIQDESSVTVADIVTAFKK